MRMIIKNIPQITVKKEGVQKETKIFLRFLNNPLFPTHRNFILQAFPELKRQLDNGKKNERAIVFQFVKTFYQKNDKPIRQAVEKSKRLLSKHSSSAFEALGKIMEYSWPKNVCYTAIPTILPFSPFEDNKFYFSILGNITDKDGHDIIMIAIHEVSHFIFFELLKDIERALRIKLSRDAVYYLKEAVTVALLNKNPLRKILKIKEYRGNPELHELYVSIGDRKMKFVEFIKNGFRSTKSFQKIMEFLVSGTYIHDGEFKAKRKLWNRFGRKIFTEKRALIQYKKPIPFDLMSKKRPEA